MTKAVNWSELPVALSVHDLKTVLPLGNNQIYELCRRKDFPAVQIGKKYVISRDALKNWLEKSAV